MQTVAPLSPYELRLWQIDGANVRLVSGCQA